MNKSKDIASMVLRHAVRMIVYVGIAWIFVSQYFAYLWIRSNYTSAGKLMGTVKTDGEVSMTVEELISVVAKEAVISAKK